MHQTGDFSFALTGYTFILIPGRNNVLLIGHGQRRYVVILCRCPLTNEYSQKPNISVPGEYQTHFVDQFSMEL